MRSCIIALTIVAFSSACTSDPAGDEADATDSSGSEGESESDGGEGSQSGDGDGDGDDTGELPTPADLPTATGTCPSFTSGDVSFSPAGIAERGVKLWVGDDPQPGGMLVIYWHAYTSAPDEAVFTLSAAVIDAIVDAGGVVAAPYSAEDSGEFPWFAVSNSPRQDDMLLADEIVACAIEQVGIDPARIHATGMSAGGIQTTAFSMARSRYIASVTSFSGGAYTRLPFEDASNKFAAMIVHGGNNDLFGGVVNFKTLSTTWFNQLTQNGNFAFMCDHGGGHSIPSGYGAAVTNFFHAHPFGTEPSPYAEGLPDGVPDHCSL